MQCKKPLCSSLFTGVVHTDLSNFQSNTKNVVLRGKGISCKPVREKQSVNKFKTEKKIFAK